MHVEEGRSLQLWLAGFAHLLRKHMLAFASFFMIGESWLVGVNLGKSNVSKLGKKMEVGRIKISKSSV